MANLDRDSSEIEVLLRTLKSIYKSRGLLYQNIAAAIGCSETSVKRYLTGHALTVEILERLCRAVDLRITDLVAIVQAEESRLPPLSHEDEERLAADTTVSLIFYLIAKGHTPESIQADFNLTDAELNKYLTKLDRWGLIQLHPFNRVKMRVSPLFHVEKGGPLARSARQGMLDCMFRNFDLKGDDWTFSIDKLSPSSVVKARELLREFTDALAKIAEQDRTLPRTAAAYHGMFVLMKPIPVPNQERDAVALSSAKAA
jgi:transcriptional regulator with XRE-family HTH domain